MWSPTLYQCHMISLCKRTERCFWGYVKRYLLTESRVRQSNQKNQVTYDNQSLRKQPTFRNSTTGFPAKWRHLRNERRNSILMTSYYLLLKRSLFIRGNWFSCDLSLFHDTLNFGKRALSDGWSILLNFGEKLAGKLFLQVVDIN